MEVVGVVEDDDVLLAANATVEAVGVQIGILTWTCQMDNDIQNDFVWKAPSVLPLCYVVVQHQGMEQEKAETVRMLLLYLLL